MEPESNTLVALLLIIGVFVIARMVNERYDR